MALPNWQQRPRSLPGLVPPAAAGQLLVDTLAHIESLHAPFVPIFYTLCSRMTMADAVTDAVQQLSKSLSFGNRSSTLRRSGSLAARNRSLRSGRQGELTRCIPITPPRVSLRRRCGGFGLLCCVQKLRKIKQSYLIVRLGVHSRQVRRPRGAGQRQRCLSLTFWT
jgi:hypothetical protein